MNLPQLHRVRWAVRAVLVLGVAASVTANILHATPNPISQAIAAWPPLALLITIELVSRVPVHRAWLANIRRAGTTTIAAIAAWVSYWHMAGVAARYGEAGASPFLLPLSVDGLVVIASVSLVELAGRIRDASEQVPLVAAEKPDTTPAETLSAKQETPPASEPAPAPARRPSGRPSAAKKVAKAAAKMPDAPVDKIAKRAGVSPRTVRRHRAASQADVPPVTEPVNGSPVPELVSTATD